MYVTPPCPMCGSEARTPVYPATRPQRTPEPWELSCVSSPVARSDAVVRCGDCGLLYTCPRPSADDYMDAYRRLEDSDFLGEAAARRLTYARQLDALERFTRGRRGRLLDAGCSMGFFLKAARDRGWATDGLDPSRWAVEHARREYGLAVREGTIAETDLGRDVYDAITIWDVVEHLFRPVEDFTRLAAALKPGGVLALGTHSIGSPAARVMGRRYPFLMPMHTMHFTPKTTADLLLRAGLVQVRTQPHRRYLRFGYAATKLEQRMPWLGAAARIAGGALGLSNLHFPVGGLGLFEAFAVKPDRQP